MSAYLLSFGGLLLFGGRTADLLGGRRMLMVGTALFLVASVVCGFAWTGGVLISARVVQGIAAAVMAPTAMAVLMATFPEGKERNRAIGVWTGVGAFGATAALLVGGSITQGLGWAWIFFINIPLTGIVLLLGPRLLRETAIRESKRSYDPFGAITVTGSLVLLAYAVVEAPAVGWGSVQTLGLLAGAVLLFALFLVAERGAKAPLVPLRVFRLRSLVSGNLMTILVSMTIYGGALMMSIYAQEVLGYSAVMFGLSTAIYAFMSVDGSNLAGPLTTRFSYKKVAVLGAAALSLGAYLLSRVTADGNYWTDLFPAMVVFGYGIGTTVVASAIAALSNVPANESGLASGINQLGVPDRRGIRHRTVYHGLGRLHQPERGGGEGRAERGRTGRVLHRIRVRVGLPGDRSHPQPGHQKRKEDRTVRTSWQDLPTAVATEMISVLGKEADEDWSRRAGDTSWNARQLLDHITLAVTGYAGLLIARPDTPRYIALRTGNDPNASVHERFESIGIAATLLSHTVRATGPEVRAYHSWGTSDAPGFAAMGAVEMLVHTHDLTRTFGSDWTPPDDLAVQVVTRLFPNAPADHPPGQALLWGCGRIALPGHPQLPRERWQWYGEVR
ncbi:hypothetical protein GCM10009789_77160 [Kribbella sancticallisti]|uniref:Major facilitator superfamily (MFS) profile domain-containing protein n=2 Tax=Kribbella sancticallisti TaxID=460087 RepID=A0ABP4QH40_9ACTN